MANPRDIRCKGCGEVLDADSGDVIRVDEGGLAETKTQRLRFVKDEPWGYMHNRCFKIAIGDPDAADLLAEPA